MNYLKLYNINLCSTKLSYLSHFTISSEYISLVFQVRGTVLYYGCEWIREIDK